jgi:uncharacterized protein (DUF2336 family)
MSETQTAMADTATTLATPAHVATKPRVSADAFRNLTARLKKSETAIPNVMPAVAVAVAPVCVEIPSLVEANAQEAFILPELEPVVAPAVAVDLAVEPTPVEAVELKISEAFNPTPVEYVPDEPIVGVVEVLQELPVETQVMVETVAAEVEVVAEPQLEGSFDENFTFVPEPGKEESKPDLAEIDEAVKREVAERATQLALENNWRLLLAKATAEDRAQYLREAAEYHAADIEWNKPEPEHDLSKIAPAEIIAEAENIASGEDTVPAEIIPYEASLPVAEGQDLGELSRSLLDMMAAGNSSGLPHERALAADTLLRLVPRLELKPLIVLTQRLAMMDNPPHLLVSRLIRDPRVAVAGPLLEDCPQITDKDLEQVVEEGEPAKMRMIARRRKLSRAISDVLVKSGDPSVVLTLVRNMEAEISHDGFESLLLLCENNEELMAPLATRHDLTAPMAFELFWPAPVQLRRYILSRFLTDSETLTKILKITMATNSEDETAVEPLSQHALLEALERAARGHIEVAAEELAGIMHISSATAARVLSDLQGDALVVLLKTAGYPRGAVSGLLKRMQDAELPLVSRERDISELQSMFETLSFNKARILLTYWDWAQSKTGPYAPAH